MNRTAETSNQGALESEPVNLSGEAPAFGDWHPIVALFVTSVRERSHDTFSVKSLPNPLDVLPGVITENAGSEGMDDPVDRRSGR